MEIEGYTFEADHHCVDCTLNNHRSLAARLIRLARREARSHVTMLRGREYRALICAVDPFTGGTTTCAVIFQSEA